MSDKINPNVFEITFWHAPLRFGMMAITDRSPFDPETGETQAEVVYLPTFETEIKAPAIEHRGDLVRPETREARERFIKKHFFKKVWGLQGREAIEAFKVEYCVLTGQTVSSVSVEELFRAFKNFQAKENISGSLRLALVTLWDLWLSHLPVEEVAERLHHYKGNPNSDTIRQAIRELKLPRSPGPVRIVIQK